MFFPLQNAVCFIILTYLVPVLFTFLQDGAILKHLAHAQQVVAREMVRLEPCRLSVQRSAHNNGTTRKIGAQ